MQIKGSDTLEQYAIYLRKSRADQEAELHGEGETLARHEKLLLDLAKKQKLNIVKIYREIVSGESINARPQMKELLFDVMQGKYAGVLCVEVERLARGDTMDQGEVAKTFKFGNCKIITPTKTYDPNNEFDEEYFEFGLFMSRREYKTINRRIQRGRIASVEEGKWICSTAPYGYTKIKIPDDKGWTLEINPDEATIVKKIYELYTKGIRQNDGSYKRLGQYAIAKYLDRNGIKPRNSERWSPSTLKDMLTNPVYIGKVRWGWRPYRKVFEDGNIVSKRSKLAPEEYRIIDGIHEPIIDEYTWNMAQRIRKNMDIHPIVSNKILKNPLSGIAYCGICGSKMTRSYGKNRKGYYSLRCSNRDCSNVSAPIFVIERELIRYLREWLENYKLKYENSKMQNKEEDNETQMIGIIEKDISKINKQIDRTYDLLEQGVYDNDTFIKRNRKLTEEKEQLESSIINLNEILKKKKDIEYNRNNYIPEFESILDNYFDTEDAGTRNEMLKKIVQRFNYVKTVRNKKGELEKTNFLLDVYPVLPQSKSEKAL